MRTAQRVLSKSNVQRTGLSAPLLLGAALGAAMAPATAQTAKEFNPEALYAPQLSKKGPPAGGPAVRAGAKSVVDGPFASVDDKDGAGPREIAPKPAGHLRAMSAWSDEPAGGPSGRPLPLAGSWSVENWNPDYLMALLKEGKPVLLTFMDPSMEALKLHFGGESFRANAEEFFESHYRAGLEFARKHHLPIAIRGWNWGEEPVAYQAQKANASGERLPLEKNAALLVGGVPQARVSDPLGPVEAWEEWGRFWFGNSLMRKIQEVYPDPPLVFFLNNNESGEPHEAGGLEKADRFRAVHGEGPHPKEFVERVVREGFDARYGAMFAAAKGALVAPAWKAGVRTVAYNTLFGALNMGNGGVHSGLSFDRNKGWTAWRRYDGDMTELYSNNWQEGKSESRPSSMQVEAGNLAGAQGWLSSQRPGFLFTNIFWDGGLPSGVSNGVRSAPKTFQLLTQGERWNVSRYEGWVQFCLWTARPRLAFEFRGGEARDAIRDGTWMALVNSLSRPWNSPLLEDFWRFGKLVANPAEAAVYHRLPEDAPSWMQQMERSYLLTCDANPSMETLRKNPHGERVEVYALALVTGQAPKRRWLVYAHAPCGARADVGIQLPEFGALRLPSVPQSGSFFLVEEKTRKLSGVQCGGPDALRLVVEGAEAPRTCWRAVNTPVQFIAEVAHAPGRLFQEFEWDFGDGQKVVQRKLENPAHPYSAPGMYLATLRARDAKGVQLEEQMAVCIGPKPDRSVIYHLPLSSMYAYEGPWESLPRSRSQMPAFNQALFHGGRWTRANGQPMQPADFGDVAWWRKYGEPHPSESVPRRLLTCRHVPNAGDADAAVSVAASIVQDSERGGVLEFQDPESALWMVRDWRTVTSSKGCANRTVSFWFKADDTRARQVLYASGYGPVGCNVYLDCGKVYAGSWALPDVRTEAGPVPYGWRWKGAWISHGPIEAGRWYHVSWMLKEATGAVEPNRQHLFVNGTLVGTAEGANLPAEYVPPRLGRAGPGEFDEPMTRFHDQTVASPNLRNPAATLPTFRGRFSEFRLVNAAEPPAPSGGAGQN